MPRSPESKVLNTYDALKSALANLRSAGKKIVSTNGCFDVLHWGHIQYLNRARSLGDVLICALNSDASVKRLKGPARPVHALEARMLQVAGLESVDFVVSFDEDTPEQVLEQLRPDIHVKGGDYRPVDLPEAKIVEKHGGRIEIVALAPGFSTTSILQKG